MNRVTSIWIIAACLSLAGAYAMRPIALPPPTYEDTNELLFPGFEDPNAAASLEVQSWNETESSLQAFKVEFADGVWVIPSHNNYPADGVEQMGKAAASFIGVRKDVIRSDDPKEHAEFGVVDPSNVEAKGEDKGQHITIKDASGTVLVDVIVGRPIPNRQGFRFLRYADKNRVYAVKLEVDVSTDFSDWIEKDLLKIDRDKIVSVISNSYNVDEQTGKVVNSNPLQFEKKEGGSGSSDWELAEGGGKVPKGKKVKSSTVNQVLGAMSRVKIVGVRPQPKVLDGLTLMRKGFFVSQDQKRLFGNEGELTAIADDGVVFTLYFGEITHMTGRELTAGQKEESAETKSEEEKAEEDDKKADAAHRFMFVNVGYDPSFDKSKSKPLVEVESSGTGTGADPEDGSASETTGTSKDEEKDEKELTGEEKAQKLRKRFDRWFYVVSNSSFEQMHKLADDFWEDEVKSDPKK